MSEVVSLPYVPTTWGLIKGLFALLGGGVPYIPPVLRSAWFPQLERDGGYLSVYDLTLQGIFCEDNPLWTGSLESTLPQLPEKANDELRLFLLNLPSAEQKYQDQMLPLLHQVGLENVNFQIVKGSSLSLEEYYDTPRTSVWHRLKSFGLQQLSPDDVSRFHVGKEGYARMTRRLKLFETSLWSYGCDAQVYLVVVIGRTYNHESSKVHGEELPLQDSGRSRYANFEIPLENISTINRPGTPQQIATEHAMAQNFIKSIALDKDFAGVDMSGLDPREIAQLFILRGYRRAVTDFDNFLSCVRAFYAKPRDAMMDPANIGLHSFTLNEVLGDAYLYQAFRDQALEITASLEGAVDIFSSMDAGSNSRSARIAIQRFVAELRVLARRTRLDSEYLRGRIEHHLRYLEHARSVRESQSLKTLTQLASIFLPLTLATGILSMQNRVHELGAKFYDFCGVFFITATIAFLCLVALNAYGNARTAIAQLERGSGRGRFFSLRKKYIVTAFISVVAATWILISSSFVVGFVDGVPTGLKVLAVGVSVSAAILIILACVVFTLSIAAKALHRVEMSHYLRHI